MAPWYPRSQKRDLHPTDEGLSVRTPVLGHPALLFRRIRPSMDERADFFEFSESASLCDVAGSKIVVRAALRDARDHRHALRVPLRFTLGYSRRLPPGAKTRAMIFMQF